MMFPHPEKTGINAREALLSLRFYLDRFINHFVFFFQRGDCYE